MDAKQIEHYDKEINEALDCVNKIYKAFELGIVYQKLNYLATFNSDLDAIMLQDQINEHLDALKGEKT